MKIRRRFCLLLLSFLTYTMFWANPVLAKTLYIGDSRTVGMAKTHNVSGGDCSGGKWDTKHCQILNNSSPDGDKWFCQIGAGLALLKDNKDKINSSASDCDTVVVSLGVNDLYNCENGSYTRELNKFASEMKQKGTKVVVTTINPVSDATYRDNPNLNNQKIDQCNKKLKQGLSSDVQFVDTNSCIKGSAKYTDGLHYKPETNQKVQQCIVNSVGNTPTGGGNTPKGANNFSGGTGGGGSTGGASPGEAVKCDELSEEEQKKIAEEAYEYLSNAKSKLEKMATSVARDIEAENGVCHYLRESGWFGLTEETADESGSEFGFSDAVKSGAQKIDELISKSPTAVSMADFMVDGEVTAGGKTVSVKEITDWSFEKLYQKAASGAGGVENVVTWAKSAQVGDFMRLDEKESKLMCARVQCQTNCNIMYRHDANSYVCMRSSSAFPSKESDGKCYENKVTCYPGGGFGGSNCVTTKTEKSCTVRLGMSDHYKEIAHNFSSADDIQSTVTQSESTQKCLNALKELAVLRGDPTKEDSFVGSRKEAKHRMAALSGESSCSCVKDENGDIDATCTSETEDDDNKGKECKSVSEYQAELSDVCPTCDLLATIAAAAQNISKGAFEAMANDLTALLAIGLLIFIAYQTLLTVASPEAQKISKYLTTLLIQGFKVALTIAILQNPSFLYKEALGPILDSSVDFGMTLISVDGGNATTQGGKYASKFDASNEYLDAKTLQNLVGVADSLNGEVATMPAIGRALICRSFDPSGFLQTIASKFVPFPYQFAMFVEGVILYVFGMMILLSLIAYMLDCVVELGFVCAIMAFCVACWPFRMTSNYTKVGWNMFLNVFFNFVMLGIIVTAIVNISIQSISGGMPKEEFIALVNGDNIDALSEQMSIGGMQMLIVLACALICLKLPKEIGNLANKFAGGAQISIGSGMVATAAGAATNAAIGKEVLQKGQDGKRHLGGALGLGVKGASALGGSIAEHTGLKGAANAAGKAISGKAKSAAGLIGLGSKAKMGAKGRDKNANKNTGTENQFKKDE